MRSRHIAGLLVAVSLFLPPQLAAQSRPIELGTYLGVSFDFGGGSTLTTVSVPTGTLRVGFWMNDRVSVEPNVGFNWLHISGESLTTIDAALALLYHFNADATRARPFVSVFPGLMHFNSDGSTTQFYAGAGLGVLLPMQERLAVRLEGRYYHTFASDEVGSGDTAGARIGFSFFTN
jgi:hypothetical protein